MANVEQSENTLCYSIHSTVHYVKKMSFCVMGVPFPIIAFLAKNSEKVFMKWYNRRHFLFFIVYIKSKVCTLFFFAVKLIKIIFTNNQFKPADCLIMNTYKY